MSIGEADIGGAGLGDAGLGGAGLRSDPGTQQPFCRITAPAGASFVANDTIWAVASSSDVEVSLDGSNWLALGKSGIFSAFGAQWTAIANLSGVTLQARLTADTGVNDSVSYTKVDDTLQITAPTNGEYRFPNTSTAITYVNLPDVRIDCQPPRAGTLNPSAWRAYSPGANLDDIGSPPGQPGDPSCIGDIAEATIRLEARLPQITTVADAVDAIQDGATSILSPAPGTWVGAADTLQLDGRGGGVRSSCDGGATWVTHGTVQGTYAVAVDALGAPPTVGGAFTVTLQLNFTNNSRFESQTSFNRFYDLAFAAPSAGASVTAATELDMSTLGDSGTVEVKLGTETTWVTWNPTFTFGDLFNWAGTADGAITVDARMVEDIAQVASRSYTKAATPDVRITAPVAGSTIYGEDTSITVVAVTGVAEMSWDGANWTDYSGGMRADAMGGWGLVADGSRALQTRLKGNTGVTDTRLFVKTTRTLTWTSPAPGSTVYADTLWVLTAQNATLEVRIGTGAWEAHSPAMRMDALADWAITPDGPITLETRLVEDNTQTLSQGHTKATRTIAITAPSAADLIASSTQIDLSLTNSTGEISVNGGLDWTSWFAGMQLSDVTGWSGVSDGASVTLEARSAEDTLLQDSIVCTKVQISLSTPGAGANVLSTTAFTFSATAAFSVEAQLPGQAWLDLGLARSSTFGALPGFSSIAYQDPADIAIRFVIQPSVGASRSYTRNASLVITAPPASSVVAPTTEIVLTEDGFQPQVRINTNAWTDWTPGLNFQALPGWSGLASDEVFTLDAQLALAPSVTDSQSQTRQTVGETAFTEAGADQTSREAVTTISIDAPLDGTADIIDSTPFSVSSSRYSSTIEVSVDQATWLNASSGIMGDVPGFSAVTPGAAFTLYARLGANIYIIDSVNLTKLVAATVRVLTTGETRVLTTGEIRILP